jgi:hypothetical protein
LTFSSLQGPAQTLASSSPDRFLAKATVSFPPEVFTLPHVQSLFFVECFTNPAATTVLVLPPPANLSATGLQQLSIRANRRCPA